MATRIVSLGGLVLACVAITASAAAQTSRVPRTPWGDPDIQGTYTNKYEQGTPFERPAEFEGRQITDVSAAEL